MTKENFKRLELSYVMNFPIPMEMKRLFQHLVAQIHQDNHKNSLIILAQASIRLYKSLTEKNQNLSEADLELIKTKDYCPDPLGAKILYLKRQNPKFVLFSQEAFCLIYYLLIHDIDFQLDQQSVTERSTFPKIEPYPSFSLTGVFLIANEILSRMEADSPLYSRRIPRYS